MRWDGFGWHMTGGGWLWALGGLILLVLIVALVASAVVYLGRTDRRATPPWSGPAATPAPPAPPLRPEPLDILRERYARGDITLDEFETAKRALGYPASLPPPPPGPGAPPTGSL